MHHGSSMNAADLMNSNFSSMTISQNEMASPPLIEATSEPFEHISNAELEAVEMPPATSNNPDQEVRPAAGPWRVARTLQNHNGVRIATPNAPYATFWHGQIWLAYRAADNNRIILGVRKDNEPGTNVYQEYDLSADSRVRAKSDQEPAIAGFNDRLYIAWKSEAPNTGIWFQRTDGAGNWNAGPTYIGSNYLTTQGPVLQEYHGKLYLAWTAANLNADHTRDIWFATTTDGVHWSTPVRQTVNESGNFARSPYKPAFSIFNDILYIFWGSGPTRGSAVYYAPVNLGGLVHLTSIRNGSWTTTIGNALVYKIGQQWIFTTGGDHGIWDATGSAFSGSTGFRTSAATPFSSHSPTAVIVPGYPGKLAKPWRIFVLWKNQGSSNTLWESSYNL